MDALDGRRTQWTGILTIIASLNAILVEIDVISRVWINPIPGHSGFDFYVIPVITALPLLLCLGVQLKVRKELKSGGMNSKIGNTVEIFCGLLILIAYQAIGNVLRLIP